MFDLSANNAIETGIFIKWTVPGLDVAYVSDYHTPVTIDGNVYTNIGNLLSVGGYVGTLKAGTSQLSVGLSGIPTGSITDLLANQVRGSEIEIYRGIFDPTTHVLDATINPNPMLKYKGVVTGYEISDSVDVQADIAVSTITLMCASPVEVLQNKITGRRTNPADFASEASMDRVPALANSNFNFGAPPDGSFNNISIAYVGVNK